MMGLLEAMRRVQEWRRCVTREDEAFLAQLFQTTPTHIHEVATFYPHFTAEPAGRHRVGLCRGVSCRLKGSEEMARYLEQKLGVKDGGTTPDGKVGFETMECLGACDCAPALQVDDELQGEATRKAVDGLVSRLIRD
ncbi:MAG: NAD(P)H-dependent oxidoreductase subunit E [Elusimicrobia bacterium]|nr:NAD(P)H-dependent oxidoreductase subunit E [Elusimicrobiota bacterium]